MISPQVEKKNDDRQGENTTDEIIAVYTKELAVYTRHLRNATWTLAVVTILLAVVGAITTAITWNALDDQHQAIRNQRIADSNQLIRADSQLTISRKTMVSQLRAYLSVDFSESLSLASDSAPVFVISNSGVTPAYGMTYWINYRANIYPPGKTVFEGDHDSTKRTYTVLSPKSTVRILTNRIGLPLKEFDAYEHKRLAIFYWGAVYYRDIFGGYDTTKFSFVSGGEFGPKGTGLTPYGNNAN